MRVYVASISCGRTRPRLDDLQGVRQHPTAAGRAHAVSRSPPARAAASWKAVTTSATALGRSSSTAVRSEHVHRGARPRRDAVALPFPVQHLIICRMPSVLDRPRRLHSARNASHSSSSMRSAVGLGVSCSLHSAGPQRLALSLLPPDGSSSGTGSLASSHSATSRLAPPGRLPVGLAGITAGRCRLVQQPRASSLLLPSRSVGRR